MSAFLSFPPALPPLVLCAHNKGSGLASGKTNSGGSTGSTGAPAGGGPVTAGNGAGTAATATPKPDPKPVECNLCHRKFKNIPALNGHMRLHGGYFKKVGDPSIFVSHRDAFLCNPLLCLLSSWLVFVCTF
jgi:hypothetical protein